MSPGARFDATESKATKPPSALRTGSKLKSFPSTPALLRLSRVVGSPSVADAAGRNRSIAAQQPTMRYDVLDPGRPDCTPLLIALAAGTHIPRRGHG